jgi:hypothetical protein
MILHDAALQQASAFGRKGHSRGLDRFSCFHPPDYESAVCLSVCLPVCEPRQLLDGWTSLIRIRYFKVHLTQPTGRGPVNMNILSSK